MELNLIGTLTMFKTMGMLPNFSELARTFKKEILRFFRGISGVFEKNTSFFIRKIEKYPVKNNRFLIKKTS